MNPELWRELIEITASAVREGIESAVTARDRLNIPLADGSNFVVNKQAEISEDTKIA